MLGSRPSAIHRADDFARHPRDRVGILMLCNELGNPNSRALVLFTSKRQFLSARGTRLGGD